MGERGDEFELTFSELGEAAIIREVHVYGQSLELGTQQGGLAQHMGLGSELIMKAEEIAAERGYRRYGCDCCHWQHENIIYSEVTEGGSNI
jgi:histone acetyltransferase (RNA polymerase elongator complex component)